MLFNILTVATLLSAASASPVPAPQMEMAPVYSWDVTNWEAGCNRGGCTYSFDINAHEFGEYPTIPAFTAHCVSGAGEGAPYTPCGVTDDGIGNRGVFAKLLAVNETGTGAHLQVSYKWTDLNQPNTYYNYTGNTIKPYNAFASPPLNFTIIPTENFGVA